jgi:phenylpropionate dioxygenase-like ring-hydroxylating dioxygenase large terminal subunit
MTIMPRSIAPSELRQLVRPDRVHRSIYADPAVFEIEMERLFGRAWLFVGHESQVAQPGDFHCTRLGRQPVIMVRGGDGAVRVLHNRCAHRGAQVCTDESGSAKHFRCGYHGWTYGTDGRLVSVPRREGYGAEFEGEAKGLGLAPVARTDSYRGFVFASLAAEGPPLAEWLGPVALSRAKSKSPAASSSTTTRATGSSTSRTSTISCTRATCTNRRSTPPRANRARPRPTAPATSRCAR